jgi:hypothetical protein
VVIIKNLSKTKKALLIGDPGAMVELIGLLNRADFMINVISNRPYLYLKKINKISIAKNESLLIKLCKIESLNNFDLISVVDDHTLRAIKNSNISDEEKKALLPVISLDNISHIGSKIELSIVLENCGILTPPYIVANNQEELISGAEALGYPVLTKIDASSGGLGVFECISNDQLLSMMRQFKFKYPLLIQKKIIGEEFDLSGIFLQGELIHFSYSKVESTIRKFGPASLRTYYQLDSTSQVIVNELREIGGKLGINGFANIACILSNDEGLRYFFEIDLRPTLWVNYSKYIGDDPAVAIRNYFHNRVTYKLPERCKVEFPQKLLISHRYRVGLLDLLSNKHGIWRYMGIGDILFLATKNFYRLCGFLKQRLRVAFSFKFKGSVDI